MYYLGLSDFVSVDLVSPFPLQHLPSHFPSLHFLSLSSPGVQTQVFDLETAANAGALTAVIMPATASNRNAFFMGLGLGGYVCCNYSYNKYTEKGWILKSAVLIDVKVLRFGLFPLLLCLPASHRWWCLMESISLPGSRT